MMNKMEMISNRLTDTEKTVRNLTEIVSSLRFEVKRLLRVAYPEQPSKSSPIEISTEQTTETSEQIPEIMNSFVSYHCSENV